MPGTPLLLLLIAALQALSLLQIRRLAQAIELVGRRFVSTELRITALEQGDSVPRPLGSGVNVQPAVE